MILNLLGLLFWLFIILIYKGYIKKKRVDFLSPFNLLFFFSFIEWCVFFYFYLFPSQMEILIWNQMPMGHERIVLFFNAILMSVFIFAFTFLGITVGTQKSSENRLFINYFSKVCKSIDELFSKRFGLYLFLFSIILFNLIIDDMGGLLNIWAEIYLLGEKTAGRGYELTVVNYMMLFSSVFLVYTYRTKLILVSFFVVLVVLLFSILGNRAPAATFLTIILFVYHFKIRRIIKLFNFKALLLTLALVIFMQQVVELRTTFSSSFNQYTNEKYFDKFSRDVVLRLGLLERKLTVINFFGDNSFLYGHTYKALIKGVVPNNPSFEKAPLDAGVYIKAMSEGQSRSSLISGKSLPETSWPDKILSGYVEFGYLGLAFVCLVSGFFYGSVYQLLHISNYSMTSILTFGFFSYQGLPDLSVLYLVRILTFFAFIFLLFILWELSRFGGIALKTLLH